MQYTITEENLRLLLANPKLSRLDKLLLLLFWDHEKPKATVTLRELAYENGLRECNKWNVADVLSKGKGKVIALKAGWSLTTAGREYLVTNSYVSKQQSVTVNEVEDLKKHAASIKNSQTKAFVEESIQCLENNLLRAAVVLSWVGAVSLLYDQIITDHLSAFNAEALRRDSKWKSAKTTDDLSKIKEADFLNMLESLSIIGKNVKQELEQCLKLRNACGHPNSLKFGLRKVAAHIEVLILNIFSKF
jgi:hypothetical protein